MTMIKLVATDQLLSIATQPKVASGDQNSVGIHVDFDSKWDSYSKSAVFFTSKDKTIYEEILIDGECVIPHEVLSKSGLLYIGVRGVNSADSKVKTSSLVKYKIAEGAPAGDGTTVPPSADVYQQLLTLVNETNGHSMAHINDTNNPHNVTAEQLGIDVDHLCKKNAVYTATPDNLLEVIRKAEAGATVHLLAGNYPLLTFTGEYGLARAETDNPLQGTVMKYPENLTIIGEPGVKIAGISITSGVMDNELTNTTVLEKMRLPGNLTIKYVSSKSGSALTTADMCITDNVCLRNCVIDGLHIENCYFTHGGIQLNPDSFKDYYGADTASIADTVWHRQWAKPLISNVIIKGNRFGAAGDSGTEASAVNARCVNNIEVSSNYIDYTPYGGILVHGQSNHFSTGRIGIIDNVVRNGGVQGIHVANLIDAELFVHTNRLFNQDEVREASILASNCVNTKYVFDANGGGLNKYNSAVITVENGGIIIMNDHPAPENAAPAIESTEYPGCYYRTVGGAVEWINPPMLPNTQYRTTERHNGKVVYKKSIYFGYFPQNKGKEVNTGIDANKYSIIGVHRHAKEVDTNADILYLAHLTYEYIFVNNGVYYIHVTTNDSQQVNAEYIVEYEEV